MFAKTRIRLTLLNATVFFVILACIGVIVYFDLRNQLYDKVDASIVARVNEYSQLRTPMVGTFERKVLSVNAGVPEAPDAPAAPLTKTKVLVQSIDPRIFMVFWDGQGKPVSSTPLDGKGEPFIDEFRPFLKSEKPATVQIGGSVYRVAAVTLDRPLNIGMFPSTLNPTLNPEEKIIGQTNSADEEASSSIRTVQAIINVDSEQNMLHQLFWILLFGLVGGGAATVVAGLYLANQALLPIRRSWEMQRRFAADASHELRMPLSIIQANAELMLRHPEQSALELSESIAMVLTESKRLAKLTDQLLTLARSDSDQEELLLKPVRIDELIEEVVRKFAPLAELQGVRLSTTLACGAADVLGDRDKLQQLFVILLDNSMKNTPRNGTIRIVSRKIGHHAAIVVEDSGSGIAAHDLPHIFDRFYRGDKARRRSGGGTGLGLAIAKWIAEKHGGTIAAASKLGEGTTMTIQLPLMHRRT